MEETEEDAPKYAITGTFTLSAIERKICLIEKKSHFK